MLIFIYACSLLFFFWGGGGGNVKILNFNILWGFSILYCICCGVVVV